MGEKVPPEYLNTIINRYPKLCEFVFWNLHLYDLKNTEYKLEGKFAPSRYEGRNHPLSIRLQEIIQRELNYKKSSVLAGHIYHRFGRIYRKLMNK